MSYNFNMIHFFMIESNWDTQFTKTVYLLYLSGWHYLLLLCYNLVIHMYICICYLINCVNQFVKVNNCNDLSMLRYTRFYHSPFHGDVTCLWSNMLTWQWYIKLRSCFRTFLSQYQNINQHAPIFMDEVNIKES